MRLFFIGSNSTIDRLLKTEPNQAGPRGKWWSIRPLHNDFVCDDSISSIPVITVLYQIVEKEKALEIEPSIKLVSNWINVCALQRLDCYSIGLVKMSSLTFVYMWNLTKGNQDALMKLVANTSNCHRRFLCGTTVRDIDRASDGEKKNTKRPHLLQDDQQEIGLTISRILCHPLVVQLDHHVSSNWTGTV